MTYTTLNAIRQHSPCEDGWQKLLKYLGKTKADDEPLSLITILDSRGLGDALWCLRALPSELQNKITLLGCLYAERVLPIWEKYYPEDKRPHIAIETARKYTRGEATLTELEAAKDAAKDAASAAAWAAAAAADAAWAARYGAWGDAASAARDAAWAATWDATLAATWDATLAAADAAAAADADAAWDTARDTTWGTTWGTTWDAERAEQKRIFREHWKIEKIEEDYQIRKNNKGDLTNEFCNRN